MLSDAELDKENASVGHGANNHKVPDMNASAKRKFVLRFGDSKWSNDMHVAQIKAIYGKSVKEGMLTLEDKASVKVFIKSTPAECQRLMKTLTTLKGAPKDAQHAHLAALGSCAKCASKNAAAAANPGKPSAVEVSKAMPPLCDAAREALAARGARAFAPDKNSQTSAATHEKALRGNAAAGDAFAALASVFASLVEAQYAARAVEPGAAAAAARKKLRGRSGELLREEQASNLVLERASA